MKKRNIKKDHRGEHCRCYNNNTMGAVYGLGFIGAAIYFISTATSVGMGLLGFLKALVWPAYVVYGLLKFLGM